jgi:hypothetical protein
MRITIEVTEEREYEIEHDDDYWICDSVLWKMRDEIDPPREGFVMYSPSTILSIYLRTVGSPKTSWCVPLEVTTQYGDTKVKKNEHICIRQKRKRSSKDALRQACT